MDDAELEDWFNTSKEELDKAFRKELQENLKDPQPVKDKYDKQYKKLISDYQKKQFWLYSKQQRRERLQKPVSRLKQWNKEMAAARKVWVKKKKKDLQKWMFDVKFKWTVLK